MDNQGDVVLMKSLDREERGEYLLNVVSGLLCDYRINQLGY